jgi:hypothetical protein
MDKYLGGVWNGRILSLALGVRYSRLLRSVNIRKWPVAGPVTHSIEQLPSIHPSLLSDTLRATFVYGEILIFDTQFVSLSRFEARPTQLANTLVAPSFWSWNPNIAPSDALKEHA